MAKDPPNQTQTHRRRRRRKVLIWLSLLVLLGAVATPLAVVWWYTRPAQLIPLIEEELAAATGCDASIDSARVNRRGEVVRYFEDGAARACESIEWNLATGAFEVVRPRAVTVPR